MDGLTLVILMMLTKCLGNLQVAFLYFFLFYIHVAHPAFDLYVYFTDHNLPLLNMACMHEIQAVFDGPYCEGSIPKITTVGQKLIP